MTVCREHGDREPCAFCLRAEYAGLELRVVDLAAALEGLAEWAEFNAATDDDEADLLIERARELL